MDYEDFIPIFSTEFFTIERALAKQRSQPPYYRLVDGSSVIAFVLDRNDDFLMVKQYRPSLETDTLECPAGGINGGEDPLTAIRREIREEIGYECALLKLGSSYSLQMNRSSARDHLFFGMFPERLMNSDTELGLTTVAIPRSSLFELTRDGGYLQLAGLGLLAVAGGILGVNMWTASLGEIESAFRANKEVSWHKIEQTPDKHN